MDGQRFDRLAKALASGSSRRVVLKGLLGLGGTVAVSSQLPDSADARKIGTQPTIPPTQPASTTTPGPPTTPVPDPCPGQVNCAIDGCCSGSCTPRGRCCAAGWTVCGYECCATPEQCCDGECCYDGHICIGEERCCPAALSCGGVCCSGPGQQCCGDVCLQPGQCCTNDQCPDSPDTCQTGVCSDNTCSLSEPCSGTPGTTCCGGSCVSLGTTANCLTCSDICSSGQDCCEGGCTTLGTLTDCQECNDACAPGEICSDVGCVTTTTTSTTTLPPVTSTTTAPSTTSTTGAPTTTTAGPTTTSTAPPPTTTTRDPNCNVNTDCLLGEVCCDHVCQTGLCCDAANCLELFPAACTGEDLDGNFVNLCSCSASQCGKATCRTEAEACESNSQCCDGLECTGTLPGNAYCVPSCPAGCPDGQICCNGVCQECCDSDTSNCPRDICGTYSCQNGTCQISQLVLCENPLSRSCFEVSCNPATGTCENGAYRGDGSSCGLPVSGYICCGGQCIDGDESNCGGCGVSCADGFVCFLGQCQCDEDSDCPAGHHCCNSSCLPTDSDPLNCGGCGERCPSWLICQEGQCRCNDHADCPADVTNLCRAGYCDDNGQCQLTDTLCATTNPCLISLGCNPTTGQCDFEPKCTGGLSCIAGACLDCDCVIDGACYQQGDERPNNKCDHCDANLSTTAWSPKTYCPASNIDCIVNFCDPSDGVCYQRVADPGATCLTPVHYDDWQCANLDSVTGICKGQQCYFPDVSFTLCNADPYEFCQAGSGMCQNGQCKATPQNEGAACSFGTCNSGTCQSGECVTFPINEGQNCSIGNPGPCRNSQGLCSNGDCITFPLPDGTICWENTPFRCKGRLCQQGNCTTTEVNIREGQVCNKGITECKETFCDEGVCTGDAGNSFCEPQDFCGDQAGFCNGDGTCSYTGSPPSFGHKICSSDAQCCPLEICICDPFITTGCLGMECWLPEDIPSRPF